MINSAKKNNLKRRVWVEIDVSRLRANYAKIAAAVKPLKVLCVLKANAYGLGVEPYAAALAKTDCVGFGVAEPHEALQLLPFGKPVQILSSVLPDEIAPMVEAGVTLPVIDVPTAKLIDAAAKRVGRKAKVHFKLDTGMGRLGILAADAPRVIREVVASCPNLDCEGIFSHCPTAFDRGHLLALPHGIRSRRRIRQRPDCALQGDPEGCGEGRHHVPQDPHRRLGRHQQLSGGETRTVQHCAHRHQPARQL